MQVVQDKSQTNLHQKVPFALASPLLLSHVLIVFFTHQCEEFSQYPVSHTEQVTPSVHSVQFYGHSIHKKCMTHTRLSNKLHTTHLSISLNINYQQGDIQCYNQCSYYFHMQNICYCKSIINQQDLNLNQRKQYILCKKDLSNSNNLYGKVDRGIRLLPLLIILQKYIFFKKVSTQKMGNQSL